MSTAPFWMRYVGLPFKMGADPDAGEASDCIRLVLRVLEHAGLNPPSVERRWYNHLAKREIKEIMADWFRLTEQTHGPEDYAMTVLPLADFAIAIVVSGGILSVTPSTGVLWSPIKNFKPLNYRRLKSA